MYNLYNLNILVLLVLSGLAAYFDKKTKKIPNTITFIGIGIGLVSFGDFEGLLLKIIGLVIIFFFGMFGLMGMGDLKLWMMFCALTGFVHSAIIMVIGEVLFGLIHLIKAPKENFSLMKTSMLNLFLTKKVNIIDQEAYPFAPSAFIAVCAYSAVIILRYLLC